MLAVVESMSTTIAASKTINLVGSYKDLIEILDSILEIGEDKDTFLQFLI